MRVENWSNLNRKIIGCRRCPRLRAHCAQVATVKRRQYADETYWGQPVPGFGDASDARLWILGLAPAAHGANRTGRMFTGDSSGDWLYRELHAVGLANQPHSLRADDGMILNHVYISAAARCAPPDNKPTPQELAHCLRFLRSEKQLLEKVEVILALGKIAFDTALKLLPAHQPKPVFGHGAVYRLDGVVLIASYHPSRQNTQTGRLTRQMWRQVFVTACENITDASLKKSYRE